MPHSGHALALDSVISIAHKNTLSMGSIQLPAYVRSSSLDNIYEEPRAPIKTFFGCPADVDGPLNFIGTEPLPAPPDVIKRTVHCLHKR